MGKIPVILQIHNLSKSFGGLKALAGVGFSLRRGEISSVIGPNGAGKTTLFNLITGKFKPDSGSILFDGREISGLPPHKIAERRLGRSFQVTNIFPRLSVYHNIQVSVFSALHRNRNLFQHAGKIAGEQIMGTLKSLGLADKKDILGGLLSHGDQKRLDIGIALARRPELLLLDEPTAGMSPEETQGTTELIRVLAREGNVTVLLIEHDMSVVFNISERIRVLHQGGLIAEGMPEEIRNNSKVQQVYFGTSV